MHDGRGSGSAGESRPRGSIGNHSRAGIKRTIARGDETEGDIASLRLTLEGDVPKNRFKAAFVTDPMPINDVPSKLSPIIIGKSEDLVYSSSNDDFLRLFMKASG